MERLNCPRKSPGLLKKQSSHGDEASPLFCLSTAFTSDDEQLLVPPHVSQLAALPRLSDWQDDGVPCILTQDPRASKQVFRTDSRGHVPLNVPVPFETENFVGEMVNCLRGYPGTPPEEFKGGKLLGRCIIQGMFKTPTAAKDIWVGQELLNKPLLPASFQRLVFTSAAKIFSSTYRVMVEGEGDAVGYLNPLLAIASTVNVSKQGQQPGLRAVTEDMSLLDRRLTDRTGRPLASPQRQRYFDKPSNLEDVVFDTQHVYTFVLCQSIVDMPTFRLKLGAFINLDLCPVLNGQPLQMLCKNVRTGEVVMSLLVWHKHLNYPPGSKGRAISDASSSSGSGSICGYRHSRTSSADISSLGDANSLYSGSSMSSSLSSSGSSSSDGPEEGEHACSECGEECDSDSSCCDSEYFSCVGDDAAAHSSLTDLEVQQQLQQQTLQMPLARQTPLQQAVLPQMQAEQQPDTHAAFKQPPLLEPAFSAPPNLNYLGGNTPDSSSDVPVRVIVVPPNLGTAAAAAAASHSSDSKAKAKRRSTGGKAAAAVASATKRLVARFKSCPGSQF